MVVLHHILLIVCRGETFGDFSIPVLKFTEGRVKRILRGALSFLEGETKQGRHLKNPRPGPARGLGSDGMGDGLVTVVSQKMEGPSLV